jgi:hypothetical protein
MGYVGLELSDKFYRTTVFLLTFPLYLSYPMLIGRDLNIQLSRQGKFKPSSIRSLIVPSIVLIINFLIGLYLERPIMWITLSLTAINLICLLRIVSVPARQLKSIELRRNAGVWEYVPETFQFLYWPLGVWWTQPRINRMTTKEVTIEK